MTKKLELDRRYQPDELPEGITSMVYTPKHSRKQCTECGGKIKIKYAHAYGENDTAPLTKHNTPFILKFIGGVEGICRSCKDNRKNKV